MAERSYVQPTVNVGILKYMNPSNEDLVNDKSLEPFDSQIQRLNPGTVDRTVVLADPIYCDGMIIWMINSSVADKALDVFNYGNVEKILSLTAGSVAQFFCIQNIWYGYYVNGGTNDTGGSTGPATAMNYTKTEFDSMMVNLVYGPGVPVITSGTGAIDFYTKNQIDFCFAHLTYSMTVPVPNLPAASSLEYYTKTEINNKFLNLSYDQE